ncbi:MAG: DUF4340 domain-containing protein [Gemmataceae bacterium]|nr:DUF4340 domain-containing protein [Gemmataceae bacterium]MDW8265294.1 DUF4340 domain-containing protein [Gemmataceae bacterium]
MSFKTTYILFGLLLGLLVIFGLSQLFGPKPGEGNYVMTDLRRAKVKADDIDTIEIERLRPTAEKLVFVRDPETRNWKMTQPSEFRVDSAQVGRIVDQVINASRHEEAAVPRSLQEVELDNPSMIVTLKKGDSEWKLNLGREGIGTEQTRVVYVNSSGRPKEALAVRRINLDTLFKRPIEFRERSLLTESMLNLTYVNLKEPKGSPLILQKTGDLEWKYVQPAYGLAEYDSATDTSQTTDRGTKKITGVRELLEAIENLRVETEQDFAADNAKDLAQYGLEGDQPATLRIEVKRRSGNLLGGDTRKPPVPETLLIGKKAPKKESDLTEKYYARLASERHVVTLPANRVDPLVQVLSDLAVFRNRDLAQVNTALVDAIDIRNSHGLMKLRKTGQSIPEWKLWTGSTSRDAEDTVVQSLIGAVVAKRQVKDFPTQPAEELGLKDPTITVSIWVNGIKKEDAKAKDDKKADSNVKDEKKEDAKANDKKNEQTKDEKKDDSKDKKEPANKEKKEEKKEPAAQNAEPKLTSDKPTVKLEFGKLGGKDDLVYVRRTVGDEATIVTVPKSILEKVDVEPISFLARAIKTFTRDDEITGLTVVHDKTTYKLAKETKDDKKTWTFTEPKDLAGRVGNASKIDQFIQDLRELHAYRYVRENPSDTDLSRYGLLTPNLVATVLARKTKDAKPEEFVFEFGGENEAKSEVYTQVKGRPLVFLIIPDLVRNFNISNFVDPTVFTFDASKAVGIKLTGWQDLTGSPFTLELERQPGMPWKVKSPKDFELNNASVDALVTTLSNLKAEKILLPRAPVQPEQKLETKDGALQIEVTLEGEKTPLTLTVGGPDADKNRWYAQSNKLPGDVFLLPKEPFDKMKAKPAHFRKE